MTIDVNYCSSSFLRFRTIIDSSRTFSVGVTPALSLPLPPYYYVETKQQLLGAIEEYIGALDFTRTALMLSGGMDSAILARLVPKGTKAYTFRSNIPGTTDESPFAAEYARLNGLDHEVIDIDWQDFVDSIPSLMKRNGAPIHSITPQIYKAAAVARKSGYTTLLFGENADAVFGGLDGLLAQDRTFEEFKDRYSYVNPDIVLNHPVKIDEPFLEFTGQDGIVDAHGFIGKYFMSESTQSYVVACEEAGVQFASPYNKMRHTKLDLDRVKNGESKYLIRELFAELYPDESPRKKTPMPRAVDQYLKDWLGPVNPEFRTDIQVADLSGDQKWVVYILDRYLSSIRETE